MSNDFHGEVGFNKWSSTIHGRGKRKEDVGQGAYCVVHLSTGRFITGTSKNVSREVDDWINRIKSGTSKIRYFKQVNHESDYDLELYEFPATAREAKAIEARIRAAVPAICKWLLLN